MESSNSDMRYAKPCLGNGRILMAALATLSTVVSFVVNVALFITILRQRSLHTNLNRLVLSIAVADIVNGLSSQPMDIAYIIDFPSYPFTSVGYIIWNSLYYAYLTISAYNLCVMNVDRLIAVRFSLRYNSLITKKVIYRLVFTCWIYGLITFGCITYLQVSNQTDSSKFNSLILIPNEWLVSLFIVNVLLPILVAFMASTYVTIIAWKRKRESDQLKVRFALPDLEFDAQSNSTSHSTGIMDSPATPQLALTSLKTSSLIVLQPTSQSPLIPSSSASQNSIRSYGAVSLTTQEQVNACRESNSSVTPEPAILSKKISLSTTQKQAVQSDDVNASKTPHQVIQNRIKVVTAMRNGLIMALMTSRLVLVLSLTFFACTCPYIVLEIYRRYSPGQNPRRCWFRVTEFVAWWLTYWSSMANVLCYVAMNKQLRRALKRSFNGIKTLLT